MSIPPPKPLLKWGEVIDWLRANGVRRKEAIRYFTTGKIKARTLPPSKVRHYSAAEIQREILDQLQA
jgi:hypothetical protein